jgi:XisH protein
MPVEDACQPQVVAALQKDGWTITDQQITFKRPDLYVFIDLEAKKEGEEAYIEVKCFPGVNDTSEFYAAIGQYFVYREVLGIEAPNSTLYLAIPTRIWNEQFGDTYRNTVLNNHVKIIVVDLETENVAQWIL